MYDKLEIDFREQIKLTIITKKYVVNKVIHFPTKSILRCMVLNFTEMIRQRGGPLVEIVA